MLPLLAFPADIILEVRGLSPEAVQGTGGMLLFAPLLVKGRLAVSAISEQLRMPEKEAGI
jgi:hypothetical protein